MPANGVLEDITRVSLVPPFKNPTQSASNSRHFEISQLGFFSAKEEDVWLTRCPKSNFLKKMLIS